MSNGSGIDHPDEPSGRDALHDPVAASPGAASTGFGRAWSAVQVSRPADLHAAAQALGGEAPTPARAEDASESRPMSQTSPPNPAPQPPVRSGGGAGEPVAESAAASSDEPSADDAQAAGEEDRIDAHEGQTGEAAPVAAASRLPGADALAAAVAGADPAIVARAEPAVRPEEAPAGRGDGDRRERKGKQAKKAKKAANVKAGGTGGRAAAGGKGRGKRADGPSAAGLAPVAPVTPSTAPERQRRRLDTATYERELARLYIELVKLQEWVKAQGLKVVAIFEGRDAAGKGGVIKRITEPLNPRYARVVALPAPTERERGQWYFQRYVAHLPGAGEMVFFDRSWYNRAGVDRVMGFCTDEEYREFARSVPEFERMLVRSGIMVIKYWFSVSDEEQERRFRARINDPTKRWKLSPMDLQSRARWVEYSKAKDEMFTFSDIKQAPWYVVPSDDKKRARLNCIAHLLSLIPYEDLTPEPIVLPPRQDSGGYIRPPITDQTFVPERY